MTYSDRKEFYQKIEEIRGRSLITYVTSSRQICGGVMGSDVIPEICDQLLKIPNEKKEVDILIASTGGDPIVAWRIISLLRERFDKIGVLIPFNAQSAATILALGADEIIMHPFSCLGPIDPQVTIFSDDFNKPPISFSVEDVKSYLEFVEKDLKLTEENSGIESLKYLNAKLNPLYLGLMKKSMKLSDSLANKLLSLHMSEPEKIENIVKKYNNYSHHGYTIGRNEALESGLPIHDGSKELYDIIWNVWKNLEHEMLCKDTFHPRTVLSRISGAIESARKTNQLNPYTATERTPIAMVESTRHASAFINEAHVMAFSLDGINITFNVDFIPIGWIETLLNE
ncbi:MAG: hypothetical protein LBS92_06150 [Candidatus Methanoplasma sp.]|jgi:hypothetical protein|nr:hypothetical protein [Candidatus Methanoplasma sp.]